MILCSVEPGLLALEGLANEQAETASAVLDALHCHRTHMALTGARIPMTGPLVERIVLGLQANEVGLERFRRGFREVVLEFLARCAQPHPIPANTPGTQVIPDISSPWTAPELRDMWADSLVATMADMVIPLGIRQDRPYFGIATWRQPAVPQEVQLLNAIAAEALGCANAVWRLPVLAGPMDWCLVRVFQLNWPDNIPDLVKAYAYRDMALSQEEAASPRPFCFTKDCQSAIAAEADESARALIISALAARAYDRPTPRHRVERLRRQANTWRLHVKTTGPPIRIHFEFDGASTLYTLYSNANHDMGL